MKSLRLKGYITGKPSAGRGQYLIRVVKYFENKAHRDAPYRQEGAPGCTLLPNKAHGDATYQEVSTYKKKREEEHRFSSTFLKQFSEEEWQRHLDKIDPKRKKA